MMLAGCRPNGPTPDLSADRLAAFNAEVQSVAVLVKARKISHVEGARQIERIAKRTMGSALTPHDRLPLSYHEALAAEVDAGRMTPEMEAYQVQNRIAQDEAADQQQRAAALQAYGRILQANAQQMAADAAARTQTSPAFTCTSQRFGTVTNTTCD